MTPTVSVEFNRIAVQQFQRFAFLAPAYLDATVNLIEIEHVRRTSEFQHHVIRDIDERRNAALTRALKPFDNPLRCFRMRAFTPRITRLEKTATQLGSRNRHRQYFAERNLATG